ATEEKDLHRAGEDLARVREQHQHLAREAAEQASLLKGLEVEEADSRGEVAQGQAERAQREEKRQALAAEQTALQTELEVLRQQTVELQIRVASASERGESARKELEVLQGQRDELVMRQSRLASDAEAAAARA